MGKHRQGRLFLVLCFAVRICNEDNFGMRKCRHEYNRVNNSRAISYLKFCRKFRFNKVVYLNDSKAFCVDQERGLVLAKIFFL